MNYYFTAQTQGVRQSTIERHKKIMGMLKKAGHTNTNFYQMENSDATKQKIITEISAQKIAAFDWQTKAISSSDSIVCDVTDQSSTVGYEALYAMDNKVPCLALFFKNDATQPHDKPSIIFTKPHNGLLKLAILDSIDQLEEILDDFQKNFINKPFKFNFYLPLNLYNSIAREASHQGITKSDLVRKIITDHISERHDKDKPNIA
jgi:hypothetical protein